MVFSKESVLDTTVYLGQRVHQMADQFCQGQADLDKAERVYHNTLAVYAVGAYLTNLGFEVVLKAGDSWDEVMQTGLDVADLVVKHCGRLECRPVFSEEGVMNVPLEVWEERVGYVAVELDDDLETADLLGFVEKVGTDEVLLEKLKPIEILAAHLEQIKQSKLVPGLTCLGQWLKGTIDATWLTVEELFGPQQSLAFQARSGSAAAEALEGKVLMKVIRGKYLTFRRHLNPETVVLLIEIMPRVDQQIDVWVRLNPVKGQDFLPGEVELMILDNDKNSIMQARDSKSLEFHFKAAEQDHFFIKARLGNSTVEESFLI
jgi:hypothetical protein